METTWFPPSLAPFFLRSFNSSEFRALVSFLPARTVILYTLKAGDTALPQLKAGGAWKYLQFPSRMPWEQFHSPSCWGTSVAPCWMSLGGKPGHLPCLQKSICRACVLRARLVAGSVGEWEVTAVPCEGFAAICSTSAVSSVSCLHCSWFENRL